MWLDSYCRGTSVSPDLSKRAVARETLKFSSIAVMPVLSRRTAIILVGTEYSLSLTPCSTGVESHERAPVMSGCPRRSD